jgi:hypothetical protein
MRQLAPHGLLVPPAVKLRILLPVLTSAFWAAASAGKAPHREQRVRLSSQH